MFIGAVPHGAALLGWEGCDLACRRACHQLPNSGVDGGVSMTCTDTVPQGTASLGRGGMRRGMPMGMPPASSPRASTGVCNYVTAASEEARDLKVSDREARDLKSLTVRPVTSRAPEWNLSAALEFRKQFAIQNTRGKPSISSHFIYWYLWFIS